MNEIASGEESCSHYETCTWSTTCGIYSYLLLVFVVGGTNSPIHYKAGSSLWFKGRAQGIKAVAGFFGGKVKILVFESSPVSIMWLAKYLTLLPVWTAVTGATTGKTPYKPSTWTQDKHTRVIPVHNGTVYRLSSNGSNPSVVVLDYGEDVEGIPTFQVSRRRGDTSRFEITYSETRSLLDSYMVGPFCVSIILFL